MPNNQICGSCHYYANSPVHGPWCTKNRKEVSYLQTAFDCFTEPGAAPANEIQTKVCSHCGRELPITNFGRHSRTKDGYQPVCRECQSEMNKGHKKRQPDERNEAPAKAPDLTAEQMGIGKGRRSTHPSYVDKDTGITMKWCKSCQQYLPITEFHRNKANKDGHEFDCKACHNARTVAMHRKKTEEKKARKEAEQKEFEEYRRQKDLRSSAENCGEILDIEVVNELTDPIPPIPTLYSATDDQIVDELRKRGYQGNIIKKTSFIL